MTEALLFSGENVSELENVLEYYSSIKPDSLKYKAACFLIENMPAHYSYEDTLIFNNYYDEIDLIPYTDQRNNLFESAQDKYYGLISLRTKPDLKCITAEYIINHIELSFNVWQNQNWAEHVDFNNFCEYILPYKVTECQILDNWKEYLSNYAAVELDALQYCDLFKYSAFAACETVMKKLKDSVSVVVYQKEGIPIKRMRTLARIPYGSCDDYCNLAVAVMRAQGIPCAIDFTPQWPFRNLGHSWTVLLNSWGKYTIFEIGQERPGYPHKEDHKFGKIFRKTYAINEDIYELHQKEKYVPKEFQGLCIKDVTDEYISTQDLKLNLRNSGNSRYAYLAVFDNKDWIPIHWGKITDGKVVFTKMGKDIVYLPVCYSPNGMFAVADPIKVTRTGQIVFLKANMMNRQTLNLSRKYPFFHRPSENILFLVGGKIQASNNKDFTNSRTFYTIEKASVKFEEVAINEENIKYRYWRYYSPDNSFGNIAELEFIEADSIFPSQRKVIGTKGSWFNDPNRTINSAFDKDPLTCFDAPNTSGCWVGMDFGKAVNIRRVRYLGRGDGNSIEPGDEYELFYWDNIWKSLGRMTAENVSLEYTNCPSNALFLLHNHTKGKEERIFTYEKGEQIWW